MVLLDGLGPSAGICGGMSNLTCFCPGGAGGVSPGGASCGGAFFAGAAGLGAGITCVASFRRIAFSSSADSGLRIGGVFLVLPRLLLALLLLVVLIRLSEKRRCFFRRSPPKYNIDRVDGACAFSTPVSTLCTYMQELAAINLACTIKMSSDTMLPRGIFDVASRASSSVAAVWQQWQSPSTTKTASCDAGSTRESKARRSCHSPIVNKVKLLPRRWWSNPASPHSRSRILGSLD